MFRSVFSNRKTTRKTLRTRSQNIELLIKGNTEEVENFRPSEYVRLGAELRKKGYELLPEINPLLKQNKQRKRTKVVLDKRAKGSEPNFASRHRRTLNALLYGSIAQQNWRLAYKIVSLLMKIHVSEEKKVPFSRIWPVALFVLRKLDAQKIRQKLADLGVESVDDVFDEQSLSLKPEIKEQVSSNVLGREKDVFLNLESDKFIRWIVSFKVSFTKLSRHRSARLVVLYVCNVLMQISRRDILTSGEDRDREMERFLARTRDEINEYFLQSSFMNNHSVKYCDVLLRLVELKILYGNPDRDEHRISEVTNVFNKGVEDLKQAKTFSFEPALLIRVLRTFQMNLAYPPDETESDGDTINDENLYQISANLELDLEPSDYELPRENDQVELNATSLDNESEHALDNQTQGEATDIDIDPELAEGFDEDRFDDIFSGNQLSFNMLA